MIPLDRETTIEALGQCSGIFRKAARLLLKNIFMGQRLMGASSGKAEIRSFLGLLGKPLRR